MGEVVSLRKARKQKQRLEDERKAEENRAKFGRTKAERDAENLKEAQRLSRLDSHRRDQPSSDE